MPYGMDVRRENPCVGDQSAISRSVPRKPAAYPAVRPSARSYGAPVGAGVSTRKPRGPLRLAREVLQALEVEDLDHAVANAQQAGFLELVQCAIGVLPCQAAKPGDLVLRDHEFAIGRRIQLRVEKLGIPDGQLLVCGMSLGYADPSRVENSLVSEREPVGNFTHFHDCTTTETSP